MESARRAIEGVARKEGLTVEEVRASMMEAIEAAYNNPDQTLRALTGASPGHFFPKDKNFISRKFTGAARVSFTRDTSGLGTPSTSTHSTDMNTLNRMPVKA